jgi:hypothetical protein
LPYYSSILPAIVGSDQPAGNEMAPVRPYKAYYVHIIFCLPVWCWTTHAHIYLYSVKMIIAVIPWFVTPTATPILKTPHWGIWLVYTPSTLLCVYH